MLVDRRPCDSCGESLFVFAGDVFPGVAVADGDEGDESKPKVAEVAKT